MGLVGAVPQLVIGAIGGLPEGIAREPLATLTQTSRAILQPLLSFLCPIQPARVGDLLLDLGSGPCW